MSGAHFDSFAAKLKCPSVGSKHQMAALIPWRLGQHLHPSRDGSHAP